MAEVTFVIPSVLNQGSGEKRLQVTCGTLSEAFAAACEQQTDDFKRRVLEPDGNPKQLINIYVNGKNAKFSDGLQTVLKDGDEVYILPAVAGGSAELSSAELDRFSRQVMLEEIGYNGQLKLKNSRACVVGSGGLGNPIATRLAAMGVGTLRIVDRDVIELSNLPRQTLFDESDVGHVKVEVAGRKLARLNPGCAIEPLAVSVNEHTALEVVQNCDVVVDALDSVNARYALNKACIKYGIPFVTGAAVGVSGQAFTVVPSESACYHCMFPSLDEDSMPTCSIEGVHPAILSIVGGVEVAEAVKVMLGKKPSLSGKILHMDVENLDFSSVRTFRVQECPVCGSGTAPEQVKEKVALRENVNYAKVAEAPILEELCGRNRGSRTFSITPPHTFELDVDALTQAARARGFLVENQGELGISMRTDTLSASFMKMGSAVLVGPKTEADAIKLYHELLERQDKYPTASTP